MTHKIDASTLLSRRFLKVREKDVQFYGASFWGARKFRFNEIDCVTISQGHELSLQVGQEVFTIATRPDKPKHQATIDALLRKLELTRPAPATLPPSP